jgi:two-component system phosphate regulon response regulator PhoB
MRRTVLVVDDDPSLRFLLRVNLELAGLTVLEASSPGAAATVIEAQLPDLIVSDLRFGTTDALPLLEGLRDDERTRAIPCLVVTGMVDEETRERVLAVGAAAVATKPFDPVRLVALIETLIAGDRAVPVLAHR